MRESRWVIESSHAIVTWKPVFRILGKRSLRDSTETFQQVFGIDSAEKSRIGRVTVDWYLLGCRWIRTRKLWCSLHSWLVLDMGRKIWSQIRKNFKLIMVRFRQRILWLTLNYWYRCYDNSAVKLHIIWLLLYRGHLYKFIFWKYFRAQEPVSWVFQTILHIVCIL